MIIVTRPSPYGEELVQLCHQAKLVAVHLPFFNMLAGADLAELPVQLAQLEPGDSIIVVSPQVVNIIAQQPTKIQFPTGLHYFAVGKQTALQFQALSGQRVDAPPQENSEGLIDYLAAIKLPIANRRILILGGDIGRKHIQQNLTTQGGLVKLVQCYQRESIHYVALPFTRQKPTYWVITSSEHLLQLEHYCSKQHKRNDYIVVSNSKMMTEAKLLGWQQLYLAENANNQNLFKTITSICHNTVTI